MVGIRLIGVGGGKNGEFVVGVVDMQGGELCDESMSARIIGAVALCGG